VNPAQTFEHRLTTFGRLLVTDAGKHILRHLYDSGTNHVTSAQVAEVLGIEREEGTALCSVVAAAGLLDPPAIDGEALTEDASYVLPDDARHLLDALWPFLRQPAKGTELGKTLGGADDHLVLVGLYTNSFSSVRPSEIARRDLSVRKVVRSLKRLTRLGLAEPVHQSSIFACRASSRPYRFTHTGHTIWDALQVVMRPIV
jgi:hypothetical protein